MLSIDDYELVQADLRKNRADPNPPRPGLFHGLRPLLGLAPTNYFGTKPVFLDINSSHQRVNWAALKGRPIAGVMDKMGEWDGTAGFDSWMNFNFSASCQGAVDMGFVGYIFSQCGAEQLNAQMTMKDVGNVFDLPELGRTPTDDERVASMLKNFSPTSGDPEVRLIVRQWAIGDGWQTNPSWLKTAHFRRINKIVIDAERYWRSYGQYLAFLRGQATETSVTKIDPPWIAFSVKTLYERLIWMMNRGYLPQVDVEVVYSGNWFVKAYSPNDLGTFLQTKDTWPAIWYWGTGAVQTTVEELINTHLASIPDSWRDTANFRNAMFGQTVRWLQVSGDRFVIPEITDANGRPTAVDVNVYVGPGDYRTWMGITAPEQPPEVPPDTNPDLTALTARVVAVEQKMKALEDLRDKIKSLL